MTTIVLDVMGGDNAPEANVAGAALATLETEASLILVGPAGRVSELLADQSHRSDRVRVVDAREGLPMSAEARVVLGEEGSRTSIHRAMEILARGEADALVSAGHTGATILAASRRLERLPGVRRAALASVYPTATRRGLKGDRFALILDVGATLEASAADLVGFAHMGSAYARVISRNERPKVALLSTGGEHNKGTPAIREAHALLAGCGASGEARFEFIGNVEGIDIPHGRADVVVCDGFVGNLVLKMLEGMVEAVRDLARFALRRKFWWRVGFSLLSKELREIKAVTDWESYGGAPLLGFDRVVIVAHGRSGPRAVANACKVAIKTHGGGVCEHIERGMNGAARPERT